MAVRQALTVLWEAGDRVCGKRLKALIPVLIDAMERHGHLKLDLVVRTRLLGVSPATIDRLLGPERKAAGSARRRRWGAGSAIRQSVPVRTVADWGDPPVPAKNSESVEKPSDLSCRAVESPACLHTSRRSSPGSQVGFAAAWNWSSKSSRSATNLQSCTASVQAVHDSLVSTDCCGSGFIGCGHVALM